MKKTSKRIKSKIRLKKLILLREKVNGTGYHVDKIGDDILMIQNRLAKIMEELDVIIKEDYKDRILG